MMTLEELQTDLWDFYKDIHGVRPRHWTKENWNNVEFLNGMYALLDQTLRNMPMEQRIAEGWSEAPGLGFDPFDSSNDILCEQQPAPMDAETLAINTKMRKHFIESYGDI
jgi:hypothetical protein